MKPKRSTWIVAGVVLFLAVILGFIALTVIGVEIGLSGFVTGFLMAALPVPFYVAFALWIDRFEPEPSWLLGLAFIWGAAIAVFFSLLFNVVNEGIFTALAGAATASTLTAVISAPLVEELTKGAALLLLFLWKKDEFDNVTDGIVYATMVGLGFAMTENVQYYGRAVVQGDGGAAAVFFLRGVMGPFAHPLFTSMTGIGLGMSRESDKRPVKWLAPIGGIILAMGLHALWNLSASFGLAFFATYFFIMIPAFFAVVTVAIFSLRREANIIRAHLSTVVAEGVLSREDVIVVTSVPRRIAASSAALFDGGLGKWIARRKFHALATELAFHSWRSSREEDLDAQSVRNELVAEIVALRARLGLAADFTPPEPELVRRLTREVRVPGTATPVDAALFCTSGPLQGQSFLVGYAGVQIGRDGTSSQIVLRDARVSKRHVWIGPSTSGFVAVDRGSTNGTWLNGQRIRETLLRPGDRLEISDGVATFELQVPTA
ncbi:MAG TPA: PrsW family glutamic-type intramembrane protease [Thermoanaerobaculia bacterium]|nr:PrsW family glutamic-type intramembrane protease [Thermoanaerobaculia bacterium]